MTGGSDPKRACQRFTWPNRFFPYQLDGIGAIISHDHLLLADDMGLGKTIQMIAALRIMLASGTIHDVLVLVPASLMLQWRKELRLWAPEIRVSTVHGSPVERNWQWRVPASIFLTSYHSFAQDFSGRKRSLMSERVWDAVVLDEAQKIKNADTVISCKCKQILRKRAYALTGTPLENKINDLISILNFLQAKLENPNGSDQTNDSPSIRAIHDRVQLRRKKMDVLPQLPPKMVHDIHLELTGMQERAYIRAETEGIMALRNRPKILITHILALILRLKQICNACPETGRSAKFSDLMNRLSQIVSAGHRAIVFSQFTDDVFGCYALADVLKHFNPLVFTGGQSIQQRADVIRRFKDQRDHEVLILSLRAGGLGLNLQDASYVFHMDRWWNPAVESQAEDRAHRLGQTVPVNVYRYITSNTIEERIDLIIQKKRHLFREIVDDVSIDLSGLFSRAELLSILGLEDPEKPGRA
ncbi:DEAD/DEAH box helicase [bacterium]|nr:DEAD/DEAH box helicase [candidate division CSSED10-310 bacterium]